MGNSQGKHVSWRLFEKLSYHRSRPEGLTDKRPEASLGIIRLDYSYPPAPGDIDHPGSFGYKVYYRVVPGLTFEMCQSGVMTPDVTSEFILAIRWLDEEKKVSAITGDCGFMFWFQAMARRHTKKPVLLSSLTQLCSITSAFTYYKKIAILTANGKTLAPMYDMIAKECGVEVRDERFVIVGCQDVPGFEAVELGEKVDTELVQPGIVSLVQQKVLENPEICAILLECTELPPYADALRYKIGLPVYDAITCADSFVNGVLDNPRFGLNGWMHAFDGKQDKYKLGVELTREGEIKCAACHSNLVDEMDYVAKSKQGVKKVAHAHVKPA